MIDFLVFLVAVFAVWFLCALYKEFYSHWDDHKKMSLHKKLESSKLKLQKKITKAIAIDKLLQKIDKNYGGKNGR